MRLDNINRTVEMLDTIERWSEPIGVTLSGTAHLQVRNLHVGLSKGGNPDYYQARLDWLKGHYRKALAKRRITGDRSTRFSQRVVMPAVIGFPEAVLEPD